MAKEKKEKNTELADPKSDPPIKLWCQFDDDEPSMLAEGRGNLFSLTVSLKEGEKDSWFVVSTNNKKFKLYVTR